MSGVSSFSFGASTAPASLFGATNTTASSFPFGQPTTSQAGTGGIFGTTQAATTTTQSGFTFGAAAPTSATAPSLFSAVSSAPATGLFSFAPATSTSTGLTGFGVTSTAQSSLPTFGATAASTSGFTFGNTTHASVAATSPAPKRGLGGVDLSQAAPSVTFDATGKVSDSKTAKDAIPPKEIIDTVETFKKYVEFEKNAREENARILPGAIYQAQQEVVTLRRALSLALTELQRNVTTMQNLKQQTLQEVRNAQAAQRIRDAPPGLPYDYNGPREYFERLVSQFEHQMLGYRQQIDDMERHMVSLQHNPLLTPHELLQLLHKQQESFVALAAKLQVTHQFVTALKEHYLTYRRTALGDTGDVFEQRRQHGGLPSSSPQKVYQLPTTQQQSTQGSSGLLNTSFGSRPLGSLLSSASYPARTTDSSSNSPLQQSPAGTKRGKKF